MNPSETTARRRQRVSYEQVELLVEYLEQNRDLAAGFIQSTAGRHKVARHWETVAAILNAVGDGARKDSKGWSSYWSDFKNKLKKKRRGLRADHTSTGGGRPQAKSLKEMDLRVLALLGDGFGEPLPGVRVDPGLNVETAHESPPEYVVDMDSVFSETLSLPDSVAMLGNVTSTARNSPFAWTIDMVTELPENSSPVNSVPPTTDAALALPPPTPSRALATLPPTPPLTRALPPPTSPLTRALPPPTPPLTRALNPPTPASTRTTPAPTFAPTPTMLPPTPPPIRSVPYPSPSPARSRTMPPPSPSPSRTVPLSRSTRRRRCRPLLSTLDTARQAIVQIEQARAETERQNIQSAADSAAATARMATAVEALVAAQLETAGAIRAAAAAIEAAAVAFTTAVERNETVNNTSSRP